MDSNTTRKSSKEKRLTQNQFIREMKKYKLAKVKIKKVDNEVLFYLLLICQGVFDLKDLRDSVKIKYPLAIIYCALYRLSVVLNSSFKTRPDNTRNLGANYYLSLARVEKHTSKIVELFSYSLFGVSRIDKINKDFKEVLEKLTLGLGELCTSLNLQIDETLYLACEFFKEISPDVNLDKSNRLMRKIVTFRELYLIREDLSKMRGIDKMLREKFEELI